MDQIHKFLKKLSKKHRESLLKALKDIGLLSLKSYDIKKIRGLKNTYRVRLGKIRIVFEKGEEGATIINIDFRDQAYKKL